MKLYDYDLFIFDLDDTLVKTEEYHYKIWLEVLQTYKQITLSFDSFCEIFHSNNTNSIKKYIINDLKLNNYEEIINKKNNLFLEFINKEKNNIKLIDGVENIINYIQDKNKKFIIVTNSSKIILEFYLELFPILKNSSKEYYREIFINRKPNPDCYLKVKNDFPDYKMICFEDNISGIHALHLANNNMINNIDIVFINNPNYYHYNYIIENYDIKKVIQNYNDIIKQCRICKNKNCESFFKLDIIKASFLQNLTFLDIKTCNSCGFCFSNFTQEDTNTYYQTSTNYTHNLYSLDSLKHDRYEHLYKLLKQLNIKEEDDIIDLTGSDYSLVDYLYYLGYKNISYCDIAESNVKINNRPHINKYKLNIFNVDDYKKINKKFKFLFFNHTLEHIIDIKIFFDYLKILMNNDSLIYIEVPDMNKLEINNNPLLELSYEHVNFFNIDYLNYVCSQNNYNNIYNGKLSFLYRINVKVNACYGVYEYSKNDNNIIKFGIENNNYLQNTLKKYIDKSLNIYNKLYKQINKDLIYSVIGVGLYGLYFLSLFKDIKINQYYDESKEGSIDGIIIRKFEDIQDNENILILSSLYYDIIYKKLIEINIKEENIIKLDYKN
jgi:beta-phosphoglucomutase